MTADDPFTLHDLDPSTLDAAYRLYRNGALDLNAALSAMDEAGLPLRLARLALEAEQPPSLGYLAVAAVAG